MGALKGEGGREGGAGSGLPVPCVYEVEVR